MSFKKNFLHFLTNSKQNKKNTLQTRTSRMEPLEDRRLLDAIGFTDVHQTKFQATFEGTESPESHYLILEVRAAEGTRLSQDFSVSIRDASAEEGEGEIKYRTSKIENNVASFLAEYIISSDKTYAFEVGSELENSDYEVRFVMAGDLNGDNVFSDNELYQLKGQAYKSLGTSVAFLQRYKLTYGVEIPNQVDTLYDFAGNGKLEVSTFREVIAPTFSSTIDFSQTITTIPVINDLKIGGETPAQDTEEDFTYVSNKTSSISGKTAAKTCDFSYETADGTYELSDFDLTQESAEIVLTSGEGSEAQTLTFDYELEDGVFTILPQDSAFPEGTLEMELEDQVGQTVTYTLVFDLTAPEIQASKAYIGDTPNDEDEYYTNQSAFDLNVKYTIETGDESSTLEDVLAREPNGIYIHVYENDAEIAVKRLTESTEAFVSMKDVKEGAHTYNVQITDLAGNRYGTGTVSVVVNVDFTAPTLKVEGYEVTEGKEYMLVLNETVTLTPQTDTGATIEYEGELEYTKSEAGAYTFSLEEGLNSIVFTATDKSGNETRTTCKVYYEAELKLTQGENVTKNVTTQSGSVNLYDYFNYKSDLTFSVTCALQNLESFTEDSENPGTYNYKFKEVATETTISESIVVVAKTASGNQSATLYMNLNYATTVWKNVTVKDELEDLDLHIVKTEGITLNGTIVNPEEPGLVNIYFADGKEPIIKDVNLNELYAETEHTKIYDDWRLTYIKTASEDETTFTLTLNEVDENEENIALEDGKYTLNVCQSDGGKDANYVIYRYAEPAPTCLDVTISEECENDPSPKLEIAQNKDATELDQLEGVTISVYANTTLYATTTVQFDENGAMKEDFTWDYKVTALEDGTYTFRYDFTNISEQVNSVEDENPYVVDKTAPVITVCLGETVLKNNGNSDTRTDKMSLNVEVNDLTVTSVIYKMYNNQDGTVEGIEFNPEDFVLEYTDTRLVITAVDEWGNTSTWTYDFLCKPVTSELVQDGKYEVVQTIGAEEKDVDLNDLFIFESESKDVNFAISGDSPELWEYDDENNTISIDWTNLSGTLTLDVTASIDELQSTEVKIVIYASTTQDNDYPRWINLTSDGNYVEEDNIYYMNLTTGKTISGEMYDSSGVVAASMGIYKCESATEKTLVATIKDVFALEEEVEGKKVYPVDLTKLTDSEGQSLSLTDGIYEIHFYGKDGNENPKESTEENGQYQTIEFVVNQSLSVEYHATITPTNKTTLDSSYVNALELTLISEGTISELDDGCGLLVTVTGTKGTKTLDLWKGFYIDGKWEAGEELRTDTTFTVDVESLEMEDGIWTFNVETKNISLVTATSSVSTTLDTVAPVITSSLYNENYNFEAKKEATGEDADSMSWAAPDWKMEPAVDLGLTKTDESPVTWTYSANGEETTLVENKFQLEFGMNELKARCTDSAGNESSENSYNVVWNKVPELSETGKLAAETALYIPYSDDEMTYNLNDLFTDDNTSSGDVLRYSKVDVDKTQIGFYRENNSTLVIELQDPTASISTPTGKIRITATDSYGSTVTQEFTVKIVTESSSAALENIQLDGTYPVTTKTSAVLTGQLFLPNTGTELVDVAIVGPDGTTKGTLQIDPGSELQEAVPFVFNDKEGGTFTVSRISEFQYELEVTFVDGSFDYGTYTLKIDDEAIGSFICQNPAENPEFLTDPSQTIRVEYGTDTVTVVRDSKDYTLWNLVFSKDGEVQKTIEVTGENVSLDTELRILNLSASEEAGNIYELEFASQVELCFVDKNEPEKKSSTQPVIALEYSITVEDESLDVTYDETITEEEKEILKSKVQGTYVVADSFKYDLPFELDTVNYTLPEGHAISNIELIEEQQLAVTYSAYNVEQDRSPVEITATTADGKTVRFYVCMPYEKPFTLTASVAKVGDIEDLDTKVDYSQLEYDSAEAEEISEYNLNMWLKVDLPIVSRELYTTLWGNLDETTKYPYTLNTFMLWITTVVEGGTVTKATSRSSVASSIKEEETFIFVLASGETTGTGFGSPDLCACGTSGEYTSLMELVVTPDTVGESPVFTISYMDSATSSEEGSNGFVYYTYYSSVAAERSKCDVNIKQINDQISGLELTLKVKETADSSDALEDSGSGAALDSLFVEPAKAPLMEDVNSLSPLVQNSAAIGEPEEATTEYVPVESWIQEGDEALGCSTILASGIVERDALITSLASSTAIQQTANALVDSIFEEDEE